MSNKEVKSALKNARDAIKNKEFKEALKHCKAALKLEKNNYNAWVFIGVAASELEQPDQAQTAYRKALELEPEQLLAWQGLANLYEKSDQTDFKAELPKVYQKLIELYESSDKTKCYEAIRKLADIFHMEKDYLQVARVWRRLIQLKEGEGANKAELLQLWQQMTCLLSDSMEDHDNETQQHLIAAFEKAMVLSDNVPGEDHRKLSADYLKCLSQVSPPLCFSLTHTQLQWGKKVFSQPPIVQVLPLKKMVTKYLFSTIIWVCSEDAGRCFSRLLELDPDSGLGHLGLGIRALEEGKCDDSIKYLAQGLKRMRSSLVGWCSLAQAQLKMHRYSDCATSCSQGLKLGGAGEEALGQKLLRLRLEALVRTGDEHTADQLSDANNDPVLVALKGRAYLQKGQVDQVLQVTSQLLVTLTYLFSNLSLLQAAAQSPACGEYYFVLGRLYWDMGEESRRDRSKAHTHLLKAAKLDPYLGSVFCYLGHYYREVARDQGRARGCYKRAFELDSNDAESGAASVDLSMNEGDMDTALAVLQSVIQRATPGSAKWAWMRRGLYHLKVGQHPQACADLQAALRADPQDWVCWECLGEAYLNRRSFTSALKAFAKAQLLNPSSIYSLYQTAAIKQTLGKFKEAAAEYLQIIAQEDYVPALKGLGECLLSLARCLMEDYRDGGAIDLIQQAIQYLFRAVELRPDLSCLWKLLGDACTSVSTVAPNRARVVVPGPLAGLQPPDQGHLLNQGHTLRVGERCYGRALKLMPESSSLWYDLGLNYYHQACLPPCLQELEHNSVLLQLEKALQCVKKAIMLNSSNHSYWNALGVVAMSKASTSIVCVILLFASFLLHLLSQLSHEAFKIAQSLEPLYVNCWIGQALIAEMVGSYDTMDLFRHTTELRTHTEGVKGYAYWVCATLLDKSNRDSELYRYNIVQMNAVSAAQVALSKYTERIQTDPDAFVMLGFLNEHLQLKKQAVLAYQRCVCLEMDCVCLRVTVYGRALCNTGQWEEAVHVYSSTPLEVLHDLAGLALAYCRAGLIPESISAYEKALMVTSTEKEKAYILTSLALLQHRLGNMDSAKTLLFKCSMLKEPVPESLLCLCALGLVHGDSTLASAALTELLKQGRATGAAVEQRCLLTCTLLALQGNYSAVQREASRAVHSNPGNPSLWALLSRLVPQYYPRKAKRALLYSGVNQLACGRHSGEDRSRNALKTMQRAVLLCPDDPAVWAGLMAACHTENTACSLSGTTPGRRGLEQVLMAVVSEKGRSPLAQALEGWVLQQAVTGLTSGGQLEQAEALCSQVLSVSPEHPAVVLLLRQVQCEHLLLSSAGTALPASVLEQLSSAVSANHTSVAAWHWLAEVYRTQGLLVQAVMAYRQSLQLASQLDLHSGKMACLLRLALLLKVPGDEWKELVLEATTEALKLGPSPVALLVQALLHFATKMSARETRRLLERLVYFSSQGYPETVACVARWYLLRHLHAKDDLELMDTLVDDAKASGDSRLLEFHTRLTSC
uniref:SKI3 subunit of superkiller complex n=1 Tax=Oncorhynchus kisutch TaxID=8019 RepID=A0A8C7CBH3_ONCKI